MIDLHVAGILLCEVDNILQILCKVCSVRDVISNCLDFLCGSLIRNELVVYAVRRQACYAVCTYCAVCLDNKGCGCGKESGAFPGRLAGKRRNELRSLETS